jgi:hypothetical protein
VTFCGQLEHSKVTLSLETLVLRGNTALKYDAGMAIKRLVEVHGIKRVNLENTSVPLNVVEKINTECDLFANKNSQGLRHLQLEIQKLKHQNNDQVNQNQGDGGILNVFMGRRKTRHEIIRDIESEVIETQH